MTDMLALLGVIVLAAGACRMAEHALTRCEQRRGERAVTRMSHRDLSGKGKVAQVPVGPPVETPHNTRSGSGLPDRRPPKASAPPRDGYWT